MSIRRGMSDYTGRQYKIRKDDEYAAMQKAWLNPSAVRAFKHIPYANDYHNHEKAGDNR